MRRKAKVDANQSEIVDALRKAGAVVTCMHQHGQGVPDLLVSFRNIWYLLEVKDRGGKLTPREMGFIDEHEAEVYVVRTPYDALVAIGAVNV